MSLVKVDNTPDMNKEKRLKQFVEDMLQNKLTESQIKTSMEQLGFNYSANPLKRWTTLLEELENNVELKFIKENQV